MAGAFTTNYNVGGSIDEVKKIGKITNFPDFSQPFNEMTTREIPSGKDSYQIDYESPSEETELMAITITATGYDCKDKYDLYCNDEQWFKNWYLSEVKEGLFMGTSTYVYKLPPKSKFKIIFHNNGTSKTLFIGFRMLKQQGGNL